MQLAGLPRNKSSAMVSSPDTNKSFFSFSADQLFWLKYWGIEGLGLTKTVFYIWGRHSSLSATLVDLHDPGRR
jgi:hypothetical protein